MPFAICSLGYQASGLRAAGVKLALWVFVSLKNLGLNFSILLHSFTYKRKLNTRTPSKSKKTSPAMQNGYILLSHDV